MLSRTLEVGHVWGEANPVITWQLTWVRSLRIGAIYCSMRNVCLEFLRFASLVYFVLQMHQVSLAIRVLRITAVFSSGFLLISWLDISWHLPVTYPRP